MFLKNNILSRRVLRTLLVLGLVLSVAGTVPHAHDRSTSDNAQNECVVCQIQSTGKYYEQSEDPVQLVIAHRISFVPLRIAEVFEPAFGVISIRPPPVA